MSKPVMRIIGIPMDLGQKRRGVDMGPSAIRYAGLHEKIAALGFTTSRDLQLQIDAADSSQFRATGRSTAAGGETTCRIAVRAGVAADSLSC